MPKNNSDLNNGDRLIQELNEAHPNWKTDDEELEKAWGEMLAAQQAAFARRTDEIIEPLNNKWFTVVDYKGKSPLD